MLDIPEDVVEVGREEVDDGLAVSDDVDVSVEDELLVVSADTVEEVDDESLELDDVDVDVDVDVDELELLITDV